MNHTRHRLNKNQTYDYNIGVNRRWSAELFVKVINYTLFWQYKCKHTFYKHSCLLLPQTVKFSGSKFHGENKHPSQSTQLFSNQTSRQQSRTRAFMRFIDPWTIIHHMEVRLWSILDNQDLLFSFVWRNSAKICITVINWHFTCTEGAWV